MLDESMFEDIHEIAENSAYLKAVEEKDVCLEMYESLPPYEECEHIVSKLENDGKLNFESIFNEPTGFYMMKCFLISDYCVDKAIFIKDVRAYRSMRFESARRRVAMLLYQRFVCTDESVTSEFDSGSSVFDIIRQKGNEEKRLDKSELKSDLKVEKTVISSNMPSQSATITTNMVNASLNAAQPSSVGQSNIAPSTTSANPNQSTTISPFQTGSNNNPIGVYGKSVRIVKEKVLAGQAPKDLFDDVYREVLNDLKLDAFPRFRHSEFFKRYIRTKWIETKPVTVKDFTTFRVLGRGGFGAVHACRKKNSGAIYAMKAINKKLVKVKSALDNVLEERNVLVLMKSDFVTNIKYALQDEETLYLVMDLMLGGDLKFHLINAGRFPEKRAKFYAAQVLLGLEHVHKLGIIYRDMKLENCLLDEFGNVKLSDLGLAVVTKVKIKGYAGCLEEDERILTASGKAIRVGDLQENYPATWPLLMSESGEPQKIHRVYRGKSKSLWQVADSRGSYRVTYTHRLALKWVGPSAFGVFDEEIGKFVLTYFYEHDDDIKQRHIAVAFEDAEESEIPRSKPNRAEAEVLAWRQFAALEPSQKIISGQVVMVLVKNYVALPEHVQRNMKEFTVPTNGARARAEIAPQVHELSQAPAISSSLSIDQQRSLRVFDFAILEWRSLASSDSIHSLFVSDAPADAQRLAFLLSLRSAVDTAVACTAQSSVSSILSSVRAAVLRSVLVSSSSLHSQIIADCDAVEPSESSFLCSIGSHQFRLFLAPAVDSSSNWPQFARLLDAAARFASSGLLAPLDSLPLPSPLDSIVTHRDVTLPAVEINQVERPDATAWYWVGVEVEDSRHRVVLESGSVTGNTPGYTAPEMIKNKLYGPSADIFSYGVMLYRMLCGSKPFKGKIDRDLDKAVIEKKPQFPKEIFSKEATSLLTGLLQKRPEHRLGCTEKGIDEIKEHPFFESIDWGLLEAGYIDPPFVPNKFDVNAASLKDIGDFDRAKYKHVKLDERFKQRIKNFEYMSSRALQDEMVAVLHKADENVKFEKFAPKAQVSKEATAPAARGCCVVV